MVFRGICLCLRVGSGVGFWYILNFGSVRWCQSCFLMLNDTWRCELVFNDVQKY